MLKTIFATSLLLMLCCPLFSQKYTMAAGIRIGGGIGITVQQALWSRYTAEAQLQRGLLNSTTMFTALFESHHRIFSKGTNFYLGAGAHVGSYQQTFKDNADGTVFGISGIGGLEFKFGRTILSTDLKPMINLTGGSRVFDTQAGISLRYVFIKARAKEHKWMFWKKRKNRHRSGDD